ncbi:MAG: hypothetical protein QOF81_1387, partial [Acidimicrobiaceae bacterium]|nr:hypothetical protein [Acidimicrobiaceae bacterium]
MTPPETPPPETPPPDVASEPGVAPEPGAERWRSAVFDAVVEGNTVTVTFLAFVAAIVVGGLLIAFTDPNVLPKFG